jgi:hypothetical protein
MKKVFGVALLALPLLAVSAQADGGPSSVYVGGSFSLTIQNNALPQTGPWYLYWPLEGHFVAPAPTGYPYWPNPQGLPQAAFGGPALPPGCPPAYAPALAAPVPRTAVPPAAVVPRVPAPSPLQPTSYYFVGQPPSYWYDR